MNIGIVIIIVLLVTYISRWVGNNIVLGGVRFDHLYYCGPHVRCFYLLLGILICKLYCMVRERNDYIKIEQFISKIGVMIWGVAIAYILGRSSIHTLLGNFVVIKLLDLIWAVVVLFTLSIGKDPVSKLFSGKTISQMGRNTMYIYLLHYPVRMYVDLLFEKAGIYFGEVTGIIECIVIIVLSILFSYIVRRFYIGIKSMRRTA